MAFSEIAFNHVATSEIAFKYVAFSQMALFTVALCQMAFFNVASRQDNRKYYQQNRLFKVAIFLE